MYHIQYNSYKLHTIYAFSTLYIFAKSRGEVCAVGPIFEDGGGLMIKGSLTRMKKGLQFLNISV